MGIPDAGCSASLLCQPTLVPWPPEVSSLEGQLRISLGGIIDLTQPAAAPSSLPNGEMSSVHILDFFSYI